MGDETRKCFEKRERRGDFERYLVGKGLDIGCEGDDLLRAPRAHVDAWGPEKGDDQNLLEVADNSYDFVYSSHSLEHIASVERSLSNWVRVLRLGGHLYFTVPDYSLYENETFPSRVDPDHKQTFSIHITRQEARRTSHWNIGQDLAPLLCSLGVEMVEAFLENDYFDYSIPGDVDQTHFPKTLAQICVIARKVAKVSVPIAKKPTERPSTSALSLRSPLRIYTGILGQIGDIIMFTPTARRLKELFPGSELTFAVSRKYREAGDLVAGLPYVDRLFVAECYFEKLTERLAGSWYTGWPVDLRGDDEVEEQRRHDLIFETRPRFKSPNWWEYGHHVETCALSIGVPGPIDIQTDIAIPPETRIPDEARGKCVLHNDPYISAKKAWSWDSLRSLVRMLGSSNVVLLGSPGPTVEGVLDYRGKTSLSQAAAIIAASTCYIGIDSGLMWIAGSLKVATVGLYGTNYMPAYGALHPKNPNATYIQVEGSPEEITAEEVFVRVCERLQCYPKPITAQIAQGG